MTGDLMALTVVYPDKGWQLVVESFPLYTREHGEPLTLLEHTSLSHG
ncbi:MAG TPA: hypothetical protein VKA25_14550 [Gemmatimonadales bacterium]|nr:hypothetical protein [Gemmatimonadales bacterium]